LICSNNLTFDPNKKDKWIKANCLTKGSDILKTDSGDTIVHCPLNCENEKNAKIYGSSIFSLDSSVCLAAKYLNLLSLNG